MADQAIHEQTKTLPLRIFPSLHFDPKAEQFQTWTTLSGGGVVRHMDATRDGSLALDLLGHQLLSHGQHRWIRLRCLQTGPDGARIAFKFGKGQ